MHKVYGLLCTLLMGITAFAADLQPFLKSAPMPFYPPLARQARIEGTVLLQVTINQAGEASVESLSGPDLLRYSTAEYVKQWRYSWPHPCECTVSREVKFIYKILPQEATPDSPIAIVRWFGASRVEIDSAPPHVETQVAN